VSTLFFEWTANDTTFYITYVVQEPQGKEKQFRNELKTMYKSVDKDIKVFNDASYKSFESFTYEKFASENHLDYVEKAVSLFKNVEEICRKLEN
jgi:hypothetical protein